jgi:uncharacterized protein (TIRG00374 family)
MRGWRRNLVRLLVGAGVTVGFLWLFLREVDLGAAWREITSLPGWTILAALALVLANIVFMTLRWRLLLAGSGHRIPFRELFAAICVGRGTNNVLPFRGGDLLRIESMREVGYVPAFVSIGTLFAERLLDGVVLAAWIVLGAVLVGIGGAMLYTGIALTVGTAVGVVLVGLAARDPERAELFVWRVTRRLPPTWHRRFGRATAHFVEGLGAFTARRRLVFLLLTSIAMWLADVAMYSVVGHAYGLDLGVGGYFLLEGIGNLALAVPATAAGIGTFDYLTLLGTRALDVSPDKATAYVLTMHALTVLPVTILGVLLVRPAFPRVFRKHSGEPQEAGST